MLQEFYPDFQVDDLFSVKNTFRFTDVNPQTKKYNYDKVSWDFLKVERNQAFSDEQSSNVEIESLAPQAFFLIFELML